MYFTSDMAGGYGGTDIYMCKKSGETWGVPQNLGEDINTPGNEMFPFISNEGVLYFSSDALPGLGGLDVFQATQAPNGSWTTPENLRTPINSDGDDFGFVIESHGEYGYFSSDRTGGVGNDDIYSFRILENTKPDLPKTKPMCEVRGMVKDNQTGQPVPGANVQLIHTATNRTENFTTGNAGTYSFLLEPDAEYSITVSKPGYKSDKKPASTKFRDCTSTLEQSIVVNFFLNNLDIVPDQPVKIVAGGENTHSELPKINHIYYDLDQYYIRPDAKVELNKVVEFYEKLSRCQCRIRGTYRPLAHLLPIIKNYRKKEPKPPENTLSPKASVQVE